MSNYETRKIYNHSSSKAERAGPKPAGPVATLKAKHRAEGQEMGARHRQERLTLENKLNKRRAKGHPFQAESADKAERAGIVDRHKRERDAMERRHDGEMKAAQARHPVE